MNPEIGIRSDPIEMTTTPHITALLRKKICGRVQPELVGDTVLCVALIVSGVLQGSPDRVD